MEPKTAAAAPATENRTPGASVADGAEDGNSRAADSRSRCGGRRQCSGRQDPVRRTEPTQKMQRGARLAQWWEDGTPGAGEIGRARRQQGQAALDRLDGDSIPLDFRV